MDAVSGISAVDCDADTGRSWRSVAVATETKEAADECGGGRTVSASKCWRSDSKDIVFSTFGMLVIQCRYVYIIIGRIKYQEIRVAAEGL